MVLPPPTQVYALTTVEQALADKLTNYVKAIGDAFDKAYNEATAAQGNLTDEQFETKKTKAKGQMLRRSPRSRSRRAPPMPARPRRKRRQPFWLWATHRPLPLPNNLGS